MKAYIPYGGYWATPFARWQGELAQLHSMEFAAHVTKGALKQRNISPYAFDFGAYGMTVPQKSCFYADRAARQGPDARHQRRRRRPRLRTSNPPTKSPQMASISECRHRCLRVPDLNLSIDGVVQLLSSTAELIVLRNVHRRTPRKDWAALRLSGAGAIYLSPVA